MVNRHALTPASRAGEGLEPLTSALQERSLPTGDSGRHPSAAGCGPTRRMSCNRLVKGGVPPYCTLDLERAHQIARERGPVMPCLLGRARDPAALLPRLLPAAAHRPRARAQGGPGADGGQPPQLLGPVHDRLLPRAAAALRREDRAVRQALEGLAPAGARRLPDPARRVRRGRDGDGARDPRARRRRRHLPRGHARAPRPARRAQARRRPARARDRRAGRARSRSSGPSDIRRGWLHPPRPRDRPLRARADASRGRSTASRASRWRRRSPTACGRASRSSGSGSAACSRSAIPSWSAPAAGARRSRRCWRASGATVQLVCRTPEQARELGIDPHERRLPARGRAARRRAGQDRRRELRWDEVDLLCLAVPSQVARATRSSPCAPTCPRHVGVLVLSKGLHRTRRHAADGARAATAPASARSHAWAGRRMPARPCGRGAHVTVASPDRTFAALLAIGVPAGGPRLRHEHRPGRRRAGRRGEERRRSGGRRGARGRRQRSRRSRRARVRGVPRARRRARRLGSQLHRHGRHRGPGRDGARRPQPQPARRRAAGAGRRARGDPGDPRPGARVAPRGAGAGARDERGGRALHRHRRAGGARRRADRRRSMGRAGAPRARRLAGPPERTARHAGPGYALEHVGCQGTRPPAPARTRPRSTASSRSFYREHLRDVYNYTYYRTGNHHDAEDLTTQTFIQAYRHFERAQRESNGRPLRPWLIRIAHNLAANYYRDRKRKPTAALDDMELGDAARHRGSGRRPRGGGRGAQGSACAAR